MDEISMVLSKIYSEGFTSMNVEDGVLLTSVSMIVFGLIAAVFLQVIEAPYGRYSIGAAKKSILFDLPLNGTVAWVIQELPSFLFPVLHLWYATGLTCAQKILFGMFILHYTNRTIVFPLRILGGKPTPFFVFLLATSFTFVNGWLQSQSILLFGSKVQDTSAGFVIGVGVFFCGMIMNIEADATLRNLRAGPVVTKEYKIPYGGMFEYISGPNFFGEIVEWTGFMIANGFSLPSIAFAVFTACNIGPRAVQHHKWYLQKFEDYPKNRKALIPFVL